MVKAYCIGTSLGGRYSRERRIIATYYDSPVSTRGAAAQETQTKVQLWNQMRSSLTSLWRIIRGRGRKRRSEQMSWHEKVPATCINAGVGIG
jgi:hypothetical protein